MSEPRIYTRNYIDSETQYILSHGGSTPYLYDTNGATQYVTVGANSDATTMSNEMHFFEGGVSQSRTIDTIIMKNYNLKNWSLYAWNGSVWEVKASYTGDTETNLYGPISPFTTTKMLLNCDLTKTPNEEKAIGELILCNTMLACDDMTSYDPRWRERSKEILLGDGSIHKVFMKDTSGRLGKYEASVRFNFASKAMRDNLKAIKDTGQPFLWQPESVTVPEDVYYCHWSNAWDEKYMSQFKSSGYQVAMNLKEV